MQLPCHFCETKTSWCSWRDVFPSVLVLGGFRGEVSVDVFRHCHPVWAADCEPCRPRSVNLWHTGFLAPPTPPCHGARGSAPRGHAAPPPESPAPPSYAACTCRGKRMPGVGLRVFFFLLPCIFTDDTCKRDLQATPSSDVRPLRLRDVDNLTCGRDH